ncbi:MAG: PIN domain-containing protein [Terriglobales bacterium]
MERVLQAVALLVLDTAVAARAARLEPPPRRSLDAFHLAAALELREGWAGIVSSDRGLGLAAHN